MGRFLFTIGVSLPLTLFALSFALENQAPVTVGLWPLPFHATLPLSLLAVGLVGVGFLLALLAVACNRLFAPKQP